MQHSSKNSIALSLMVLILFSTIGFNVIKTFCGGCDMEMVKVAFSISAEEDAACGFCSGDTGRTCDCKSHTPHSKSEKPKSIFAKLTFDSTEAKGKLINLQVPLVTLYFEVVKNNFVEPSSTQLFPLPNLSPPPLSGRSILTSICVFRI